MTLFIYLDWASKQWQRITVKHQTRRQQARQSQWKGRLLQAWKGAMTHSSRRKKPRVSRTYLFIFKFSSSDCSISLSRSSFNRRSLQLTKSLTHSMGGYLPNSLTEMWEPSRDFAFLRLPTSGTRSIVAFSGYFFYKLCFKV